MNIHIKFNLERLYHGNKWYDHLFMKQKKKKILNKY